MFSTPLAFALAASLSMPTVVPHIHFHPQATPDTRVNVTLVNNSTSFHDVMIDGHSYEVMSHQLLYVKAPAGTLIFADSRTRLHKRGEVLTSLTPAMNRTTIELN